jgi:formylglycine-generating enzyme required for sulfatase activity
MRKMTDWLLLGAAMLVAGSAAAQAQAPAKARPAVPGLAAREGPDFVVLKNGDDHLGRLMVTAFRIRTEWGELVLPKQAVAQVIIGRGAAGVDVLTTGDGDRISGKVEGRYVQVARTTYAPLDISMTDIAEITLTPRMEDLRPLPPFVLTLRNGDALRAELATPHLALDTDSGKALVAMADIRVMDVDLFDGTPRARIVLRKDERRIQGKLLDASLSIVTRAGQELAVPARQIVTLAGSVPVQARTVDLVVAPVFAAVPTPKLRRDRLRSGGVGPEMVDLPAGKFRRGDLHADGDSDEQPVRAVHIGKPFAIGRYPVTFEEYDLFCERTGRKKPTDEGWGRGRRPVINVSWYEAADYAEWLGQQTGKRYRLPSNAEFEYAARSGREVRFPWGDEAGSDNAACKGCRSLWDALRTAPVGRFAPTGFGLYDMSGNVWQWTQDCWDGDYKSAPVDGGAYTSGAGCDKKVVRGGSWNAAPREARAANRWREPALQPSNEIGFRVVRQLD